MRRFLHQLSPRTTLLLHKRLVVVVCLVLIAGGTGRRFAFLAAPDTPWRGMIGANVIGSRHPLQETVFPGSLSASGQFAAGRGLGSDAARRTLDEVDDGPANEQTAHASSIINIPGTMVVGTMAEGDRPYDRTEALRDTRLFPLRAPPALILV